LVILAQLNSYMLTETTVGTCH